MSWLLFAFSGPVLWAASVHLDKYLVERYFKQTDVAPLMVFTASFALFALPVIWWARPEVAALDPAASCAVVLSGMLYMGAVFFYLRALQSEEASIVAPFFQASPLFGLILGYAVLGDRLSPGQVFGALSIVAGAALLSLGGAGRRLTFNARLTSLMLGCALLASLGSLIFKIFAVSREFWTAAFWSFVGQSIFGAGLCCVPSTRRDIAHIVRSNAGAVLGIGGLNELINFAGSLGARYALVLAPLGLVQAVTSTTSLFVFLFGALLSRLAPSLGREDLSRQNLSRKLLSTALITTGVILVSA